MSKRAQPVKAAFSMKPIGVVRSPFRDTAEIPKGRGAEHHAEGTLELRPELEQGLQDIEGFSHLFVLWVFDRSEAPELLARVPLDETRLHGVFASRSPRRPNPIGLTVVELLGREGPRLRVRGLDMLDGTPILDIKPYLSSIPAEKLRRGWLAEAERQQQKGRVPARGVEPKRAPRSPRRSGMPPASDARRGHRSYGSRPRSS